MKFKDAKKVYLERKSAVSAIFEDVGDTAAKTFVAEAKKETSAQNLVKTGNYRRSWTAEVEKSGLDTSVKCINEAEYASHLEYGHRIVTRTGRDTGKKTRGRFVGLISIKKTQSKIKPVMTDLLRGVIK
nr:MAG TPA: type I neck protein [Caudoviricetes sp.]